MRAGERDGAGGTHSPVSGESTFEASAQDARGPAANAHIETTAGGGSEMVSGARAHGRFGGRPPRSSYRHEAFLWRGDDAFLAGTVPFIRDGLSAQEPVLVAVIARHIRLLRAALGTDAERVRFLDMAILGANPARIIPAWRAFTKAYGLDGQPMRGIGETIWAGRRPAELAECQLHEALLNIALTTQAPLWLLCPYDTATLGEDVIVEAGRSHPILVVDQRRRPSDTYGATDHARTLFESDLPAVHNAISRRTFGHDYLRGLREEVTRHAMGAGLSQERSAELALAVHEVAINSIQHGKGERVRRIWRNDNSLVCEIRDAGQIKDPMIGRRASADCDERGRGLWIANQLSDLIQVRSNSAGTTIRIHTWLPQQPTATLTPDSKFAVRPRTGLSRTPPVAQRRGSRVAFEAT